MTIVRTTTISEVVEGTKILTTDVEEAEGSTILTACRRPRLILEDSFLKDHLFELNPTRILTGEEDMTNMTEEEGWGWE